YRERLGGRQARPELAVDQQRPDVAEGHPADQVLDVDAAVAQRAAFPVRFSDLGLEGDHALQPRLEIGHLALLDRQGRRLFRWCSRYLAWRVTTCASSPPCARRDIFFTGAAAPRIENRVRECVSTDSSSRRSAYGDSTGKDGERD